MKSTIRLIMTSKNKEEIDNKAIESGIYKSALIKNKLHEWYLKNKDKIDESDDSNILNYSFDIDDEETARIYKLFMSNTIKNLIKSQ